jgi:hypothetical protein
MTDTWIEPPKRREEIDGLLAWGSMFGADFCEKTITLRIEGDMPAVSRGRYAIINAERFRMLVMKANAWTEQQRAGKAA